MKKIANKTLFLILIIIVTLLSGYFIYKSYQSFRNYQIVKQSEKYTYFIKSLNELLYNIEQEHTYSAIYLGYEGKTKFDKLALARDNTDTILTNTQKFLDTTSEFSSYIKHLDDLSHHLQYVRSRVDVISSDYEDILLKYYQKDISLLVLKDIKSVSSELSLGLKSLKEYLFSYFDFISYRNEINKERSFIAYMLSKSKKMNSEDLQLWDNILSNDVKLKYKNLDKKSSGIIEALLKNDNFSTRSFKNRVEVAKGAAFGSYALSVSSWMQNENEKIKRVQSCNKVINKYIKDNISSEIVSIKQTMINMIISIVLLLLLVYLLSKLSASNAAIKARRSTDKGQNRAANLKEITPVKIEQEEKILKPVVEEKRVDEDKDIFHLDNELQSIIKSFDKKIIKKKIDFNYGLDDTIQSSFLGDFSKIRHMIEILINTAINSSSSRGTIIFRADKIADKKYESAIRFSVVDSGSRIKKEERRRIKSAFYLGTSDHTRRLSVRESDLIEVAENISKMGGDFDIENGVKKGSIIYITVELKKLLN
jgi:hypothetical protein